MDLSRNMLFLCIVLAFTGAVTSYAVNPGLISSSPADKPDTAPESAPHPVSNEPAIDDDDDSFYDFDLADSMTPSKPENQIITRVSDEFSDRQQTVTVVDGIVRIKGSYEWKDAKDRKYFVTYTADENGFHSHVELVPTVQFAFAVTPAKPQDEDGIGCALRNSLCGK